MGAYAQCKVTGFGIKMNQGSSGSGSGFRILIRCLPEVKVGFALVPMYIHTHRPDIITPCVSRDLKAYMIRNICRTSC